jgi:hypothetical protein
LRIVLEGPDSIISQGEVRLKNKEILVVFPGSKFKIQKEKLPVSYRMDKNVVICTPEKIVKLTTFSLINPGRLVVDVYPGKINKEKGKVLEKKKKETVTSVDLSWKEPAKKHSNIPQPPPTSINKEQNEDRLEKAKKAESVQKDYGIRKKRAAVTERKKEDNDDDLIADKYKKLWVLLKSGKPYGVLKEIQRYKPEDIESLASHHFIFGKANESLKNYMDAVKHFRLAYIYSVKSKLKLKKPTLNWRRPLKRSDC